MNKKCFDIIEILAVHGNMTEREIMSELGIHEKSIHRFLAQLLSRGMIEISACIVEEDTGRRAAVYCLK